MDILEKLQNAGLVEKPEKPKSGIEIALEALKRSHPNSPTIPYLEKLINKKRIDEGISST